MTIATDHKPTCPVKAIDNPGLERKKILIVTYYWPPAGGPGVQRWLKFVKYLPQYGIEPIVYIPENPTYPIIDDGLLNEVPKGITILRKKIIEPYALASLFSKDTTKKISSGIIPAKRKQSALQKAMLWLRGNLFIPDARVLWVRPSVSFLSKYIAENQIDTVITSGPPHSLHLIGLKLRKKQAVRWIADFRDPWTTIGYHKELKLSTTAAEKHRKLEQEILNAADLLLVTSPTTKKEFAAMTQTPIEVITNGYDTEVVRSLPMDSKFSLAHIGSLLSARNPMNLWAAIKELIESNEDFRNAFELKLAGAVSTDILDTLKSYGLEKYVNEMGYISHAEAVAQQRCSQILLLIEINSDDTRSIIPGKLFEYLSAERPILAIGPEGSDIESILIETNAGKYFNYTERDKISGFLLQAFENYRIGKLAANSVGLQKYSRKSLTRELSRLITDKS